MAAAWRPHTASEAAAQAAWLSRAAARFQFFSLQCYFSSLKKTVLKKNSFGHEPSPEDHLGLGFGGSCGKIAWSSTKHTLGRCQILVLLRACEA